MIRRSMFVDKKALSPLIATMLLVVFALVIGTITMNWGKSYVDKIADEPETGSIESSIFISINDIDSPLKELQIQHITGRINEAEYKQKEKELI